MKLKRFTPEEDQFLRDNYLRLTYNQLAGKLNRQMGSVAGRLKRLGLILPEEVKSQRASEAAKLAVEAGKGSRFKKGHTPVNKGKKMPKELYEKCKATMFKPGQIPATCKHFGRPYLNVRKKNGRIERTWYIQAGKNKRVTYMTYLCKQNGIDMTGKKPRLKPDYDFSKPPTMTDIEIISNRKNMILNSFHRYPSEVVKLIQLKGALTRQINKIEKHGK